MDRKKRNQIIFGVLIVAVLALVIGFSVGNEGSSSEDETIKVGVIAPFSGDLAFYGESLRNGIELAKEDHDLENYEFIYEDDQYSPSESVSAFKKLNNVNEVDFIIGFGAPTSSAIVPLAHENEVPFVSVAGGISLNKTYEDSFINLYNDPQVLLDETLDSIDRNTSKLYVFQSQNPYLNTLYMGLEDEKYEIKRFGPFRFSRKDFRTELTQVPKGSTMINLLSGSQSINFYKQIEEMGTEPELVIGSDFLEDTTLWNKTDGAINSSIFPAVSVTDSNFAKKYTEKFGDQTAIFVGGIYYDLFGEIQDYDKEKAKDLINNLKNESFSGAMGNNYNVEQSRGFNYVNYPVSIREFENGEINTQNEINVSFIN